MKFFFSIEDNPQPDNPDRVDIDFQFDPPLQDEATPTPASVMAVEIIKLMKKLGTVDEHESEDAPIEDPWQ